MMWRILVLCALWTFCAFSPLTVISASAQTTLESFLRAVEASHPSLRAAQYEPDLAEAEIRNALGRFDPMLNVSWLAKPKTGGDKLNDLEASLELPLDMTFGPKLKATYDRAVGTNVDPENITTPGGEASLGVSLPLFQGIFTDSRRNQLRKALLRPDLAAAQFRLERNNLLRAAALKYWDWSESVAAVAIIDSILQLAETRADLITRRARAGEAAVIDSVEMMQEVLRRRGERLRALRFAEQSAIDVSVFLWTGNLTPITVNDLPEPLPIAGDTTIDVDEAVRRALVLRPELRRVEILQATARLDSSLATEFLRPFVEADVALVSYDLTAGGSPDLKLGLKISQPLLFRSASAGAQVADIAVQRADLTRVITERVIDADVRNAIIAVDRAEERLAVATTETELARRMLDVERRRLDIGETNLLTLNLRERFYAEALQRLVSAQADYARAIVQLRWATGTL